MCDRLPWRDWSGIGPSDLIPGTSDLPAPPRHRKGGRTIAKTPYIQSLRSRVRKILAANKVSFESRETDRNARSGNILLVGRTREQGHLASRARSRRGRRLGPSDRRRGVPDDADQPAARRARRRRGQARRGQRRAARRRDAEGRDVLPPVPHALHPAAPAPHNTPRRGARRARGVHLGRPILRGMNALEGITVVDLSRVLAGPLVAMTLGDLGADVVKVEAPGGDDTPRWLPPTDAQGRASYHHAANRNKRSVVLDLRREPDRELAQRLCERADVVVSNFKPGTLERFGLDYDRVSSANRSVVYCEISGFGE